jgi:acetolactate synthase-1/2/3 large subunit
MNGAESLVSALSANGVDVCFANPGTSEMHFVAALDGAVRIRCVLGLFEGVVTGAADGYYRMQRRPAATLLHLGPGLANGLANLHNAQKAQSAIVNIVGDHAVGHARYESPLHSDVEGFARPVSHWIRRSLAAADVARDAADAIAATRFGKAGRIATLILPADTAWTAVPGSAAPEVNAAAPGPAGPTVAQAIAGVDDPPFSPEAVEAVAAQLRDSGTGGGASSDANTVLLLGGNAVSAHGQRLAAAIARRTGCRLMLAFYQARLDVGRGLPQMERIPYGVDAAIALLAGTRRLVLAGAVEPVAFFAYPHRPSLLAPPGCAVVTLARPESDAEAALESLADALEISATERERSHDLAPPPDAGVGENDWCLPNIARIVAQSLPEGAVVTDEAVSSGRQFAPWFRRAAPHIVTQGMGGAIGQGLPGAVGVAIGAPDRQVVALEGDGSGMYTLQALWTMARESLNVVVVVFANRAYRILQGELLGVGAAIRGDNARAMLSLDSPPLDWVALARGQGVPGERVSDLGGLTGALKRGYATEGPYLIELAL